MISSCNKASKARPIIEKAAAEWRAASKSDAVRYLKTQNRIQMAEDIYNGYTSSTPCSTCNDYGVVYQVDTYGNIVTDYNGNVQYFFCPTCGGTGH